MSLEMIQHHEAIISLLKNQPAPRPHVGAGSGSTFAPQLSLTTNTTPAAIVEMEFLEMNMTL